MMYVGGHPSLPIEAFQQRLPAVDASLKQNVAHCRELRNGSDRIRSQA